jgi:glycosyltransferase involved in cell wall biosynthesis
MADTPLPPRHPVNLQSAPKVSIMVSDLSKSGAGRWGGAVRPFLLAQALRQLGCEVKIFGFTQEEDLAIASTPELAIISTPGGRYPQFFKSAQSLLKQVDGDILYAYKPKPSSFGLSLLGKFAKGRPLILDIDDWELSWHGGDRWKYRPTPKQFAKDMLRTDGILRNPDYRLYLGWMEKLITRANAVTVHTQFLKDRFGGTYVPNGKDISLFNPEQYDVQALKVQYGLENYRVLMFPGAPRPYKGVEDVLAALELLDQPDLRLVIVGGSPYDDYDQQLMARWGRWMIKLPKMPYDQMPGVIAAADVIVVPQRDTPAAQAQFPLKLTDGMAMAKPILSTRVGDIPEILGDTGYLVAADAPGELAGAIAQIFGDMAGAIAQGKKARARCIEHYSIDAMSHQLSSIISGLVASSK